MTGSRKAATWWGRFLLAVVVLCGIVLMHSLGHPGEHTAPGPGDTHTRTAAHAPVPSAERAAAVGSVHSTHPAPAHGAGVAAMCLAVLGAGTGLLLLARAARRRPPLRDVPPATARTAYALLDPAARPARVPPDASVPVAHIRAPGRFATRAARRPPHATTTSRGSFVTTRPTRRTVLGAGLAAAGAGLTACSGTTSGMEQSSGGGSGTQPAADYLTPDSKEIGATEALRKPGPERKVKLTAVETPLDLGGGRTVRSWAYGDRLPGKEVRVTAGETLVLTLANHLPEATSVHWHGLALRNDMDG